jgi:hypothetical protein
MLKGSCQAMRSPIIICMALILLGISWGVDISANAAINEKAAGASETVQSQKEIPEGTPPIQEQKIVLHPFFRLQKKGSRAWVERIFVTFLMAVPKDSLTYDFNNPTFRRMLYDLLQSGEPETTIQAKAVAGLNHQLEMNIDATAQISRSVIIVR